MNLTLDAKLSEGMIQCMKLDNDRLWYEWQGGNLVPASRAFMEEADIQIDECLVVIGPYRLRIVKFDKRKDTYWLERLRDKEGE